ncbi:BTAD domain-containing putative transcriptional regulator [Actinomadura flavalba]|uniref:BTAD domain-containing putative transcriptional regulator n=1 Tax=Actinomadura flavalba TaxID=1120938 RepID=UPI0003A46996|nr:BTAD domain-containing putative transcriptional regulator [Actinomadura flavalba]
MRFGVLGPLAVWTSDGVPAPVPEPKVRALLASLLVRPGRPVSVDRLADDLWGADLPGNPANSVQSKVSQLRRALERAEPGGRDLVEHGPAGYRLRVEPGAVDAGRFAVLLAEARAASDPRARAVRLADALALWRGDPFAGLDDYAFTRAAAEALTEQRLTALEEQAETGLELGEHARLADELGALVARHPLRERLRAVHLRALYRAGRQSEALDGYTDLRRRLADDLGLDPGPELTALHRAILRQDPALAAPRPAPRLPLPPTELIGRDATVAAVGAALGTSRLVTLTGPGGVGKTRVALEAARRFPGGALFVELAGRRGEVPEAVAAVLGVRDAARAPETDLVERLAGALRSRRALLVLDNCEHVIEPVARLAAALLARAPELHILATSREPLALAAETLVAVPPLGADAAARLFAARASAAAPGFEPDEAGRAAVAVICRRLDGLPLALELAATRVRALGVHRLAERLDDRFRLLAAGHRDAPARQRTLRAVIDWSWEPLGAPERAVLRRLAVHPGGCSLEAAEAVCGDDVPDVFDVLARLVDRSLVVAVQDACGVRYRLLESVAAYCAERLTEAGEDAAVRRRRDAYYRDLAEEAEPHLTGPRQQWWLDVLDAEDVNVRAALDHATRGGDAATALRLANALTWYWFLRGRRREAHRALSAALALDGPAAPRARAAAWHAGFALLTGEDSVPPPEIDDGADAARARWFLGYAHLYFGTSAAAVALVDRALDGFRASGDAWGEAAALATRAVRYLFEGRLDAMARDARAAADGFARLGDRWGRLEAAGALALHAEIRGDYAEAARLREENVRIAEELGLWGEVSHQTAGAGRIALLTGDLDRAEALHRDALRLAVEHSDQIHQEYAEVGLGMVARRQGRFDAADDHLLRWLDWNRRLGSAYGIALISAQLGFTAEQRGDARAALAHHETGLTAARATGDPRALALALEGRAGALALAGEHVEAAESLGRAAALRASVGAPLPSGERHDVDRISARLRAALGADAYADAFDQGLSRPSSLSMTPST